MKKLIILILLTYLLSSINSKALEEMTEQKKENKDQEVLKIGILLPLSGQFKDIGDSILDVIKLAIFDIKKITTLNLSRFSLFLYLFKIDFNIQTVQ